MATWKELIPGCFGSLDLDFAKQTNDERRAKDAIREAKKAGATREEFWEEMVAHLNPPGGESATPAHMEKQLKRFNEVWKVQ